MPRENNTSLLPIDFWTSNSECKILNEAVAKFYQKWHKKGMPSWNTPRKAKTVDSLGRITENHSALTLQTEKKTPGIRTKHGRKARKLIKRNKHVENQPFQKYITRNINSFKVKSNAFKCEASPSIIALIKTKKSTYVQEMVKPWKIKGTTLQHHFSERITKLAEPKVYLDTVFNVTGKINEKALFATASKRVNALALPRNHSESADNKHNPFGVNPQALKAVCSARLKELAKPKSPRILITESNLNLSPTSLQKLLLKKR